MYRGFRDKTVGDQTLACFGMMPLQQVNIMLLMLLMQPWKSTN